MAVDPSIARNTDMALRDGLNRLPQEKRRILSIVSGIMVGRLNELANGADFTHAERVILNAHDVD